MLKNAVHTILQQREVLARRGALYRLYSRSYSSNPDLVSGFSTFDALISYFHQQGVPITEAVQHLPKLGHLEIWREKERICSGVQLVFYLLSTKRPTLARLQEWLKLKGKVNGESS